MLRKILSITGRPGLFELISQGRNSLIVEDITTKKRFPALGRDKIISLGDIAMYTDHGDMPLGEILDLLYAKQEGKPIDVKKLVAEKGLRPLFASVITDFDEERVHDSDIKKLFSWYNLLIAAGMKEFAPKQEEENDGEETPAEEAEGKTSAD